MYASRLASRAALHLDLFEQPAQEWVFQHPAGRLTEAGVGGPRKTGFSAAG